MADVQIDNGNFTQIANVLLEKVSSAKLNGCQYAIVLQVWRYTYGFKRKEHELSAGFIAKATGYNTRQIQRDLKVLVDRKIIVQKVVNGISRTLSFNKNFDDWDTYGELADGEKDVGEKADGELYMEPTADKPRDTYGELADQERKSFKQNKQNNTTTEFSPSLILENEYCSLHKKLNGHLRPKEIMAMEQLISGGVPLEFIVTNMKQMYQKKTESGEKVTSFSYYADAINDFWSNRNVMPFQTKKKDRFNDILDQWEEKKKNESTTDK